MVKSDQRLRVCRGRLKLISLFGCPWSHRIQYRIVCRKRLNSNHDGVGHDFVIRNDGYRDTPILSSHILQSWLPVRKFGPESVVFEDKLSKDSSARNAIVPKTSRHGHAISFVHAYVHQLLYRPIRMLKARITKCAYVSSCTESDMNMPIGNSSSACPAC